MVEVNLTVGKVDASLALLLTSDHHLIEFPTILLPDGVTTGSVIKIKCEANEQLEKSQRQAFAKAEDDIFNAFSKPPTEPVLRVRNVTQTSVVLEWDKIDLGVADAKSFILFKDTERVAQLNPGTQTAYKVSGLPIDSQFSFFLRLDTTAGVYLSNTLTVKTHKMTDLSGINVCLGPLNEEEFSQEDIEEALANMGGRPLQKTVQIDTTHFVCTQAEGDEWKKAVDMSIPVVRPEWLKACEYERRIVGVRAFYLDADPKQYDNPNYKGKGSRWAAKMTDSESDPKPEVPAKDEPVKGETETPQTDELAVVESTPTATETEKETETEVKAELNHEAQQEEQQEEQQKEQQNGDMVEVPLSDNAGKVVESTNDSPSAVSETAIETVEASGENDVNTTVNSAVEDSMEPEKSEEATELNETTTKEPETHETVEIAKEAEADSSENTEKVTEKEAEPSKVSEEEVTINETAEATTETSESPSKTTNGSEEVTADVKEEIVDKPEDGVPEKETTETSGLSDSVKTEEIPVGETETTEVPTNDSTGTTEPGETGETGEAEANASDGKEDIIADQSNDQENSEDAQQPKELEATEASPEPVQGETGSTENTEPTVKPTGKTGNKKKNRKNKKK